MSPCHGIRLSRSATTRVARGKLVRKDCAQPTARLLYHTEALLEAGAEVCGITTLLFYDLQTGRAWQYPWPLGPSSWVSKLHRLRDECRPDDLEGFRQSGGIR